MKAIENLIGKQVIIRSYGAGVFFGTLNEAEKCEDKSLENGNFEDKVVVKLLIRFYKAL